MDNLSRCLRRFSLSLPLLAAVSLTSCGKEPSGFQAAERETRTVPEDMGRLVPEDAVVFAHVVSLSGLETKVKDLLRSFQPGMERMVRLDALYAFAGLRERDLDTTRPAGAALHMGRMGPQPVLILPARNPQDVADIAEAPVTVSGSYVGIAKGTTAPLADTTSSLGRELPAGDVAVRVRLDKVLEPIRPQIDPYLDPEMLGQLNPGAPLDPAGKAGVELMLHWARQLLDHARTLETSVSLEGGKLDLGCTFKVAEDSPLDTGPARKDRNLPYMAGSLPMPDASMVYLMSGVSRMQEAFMPMYQSMAAAMPEEQAQRFLALMKRSQELYRQMADDAVMAMDFTPDGLQLVGLMQAKDSGSFKKDWDSFMADYAKLINDHPGLFGAHGMSIAKEDTLTVSEVQFEAFAMKFDFGKMMEQQGTPLPEEKLQLVNATLESVLGKGGLRFAMGQDGDDILFLMGNIRELATKTIASLRKNKRYKLTVLDAATGRLHLNPAFFFSVDLRRMLRSIRSMLPEEVAAGMPPVPQGPPVAVWCACAADGPAYELQAHLDLAGIAAMVRAMTPTRNR